MRLWDTNSGKIVHTFEGHQDILFACENAVKIASNDEEKEITRVIRGIARSLTGDFAGAITDFETFLPSEDIPQEDLVQLEQWIKELKQGKNPFTDEVLEELKNE